MHPAEAPVSGRAPPPHGAGNDLPPAKASQAQPWRKWYSADTLDTDKAGENDHKPTIPINQTQAVTNIG